MEENYNEYDSRYIYRRSESEEDMFIFELVFKKFNEKNQTIRKIKNARSGCLLSEEDNILYSEIKKIYITAFDINNPLNEIITECTINQTLNHTLIINNDIFIEFINKDGHLESNYNLI
jgi:hypothetical protein